MDKIETITTKSHAVSCQGREAPYDHPLVYLEIKDDIGHVTCPYCSKRFVLE